MQLRRLVAFLFAFSLGATGAAPGAENRVTFSHLTVEEGLANSWVRSLVRGSHGFLWIGTNDGLQRYDGRAFKTFRNIAGDDTSLPANPVPALLEDDRGRLWVGTAGGGGLARFDWASESFTRYEPGSGPSNPSGTEVLALAQAGDGSIWVGTNEGLDRLDPETETFHRYPFDDNLRPNVYSLLEDRERRLWVGSDQGLFRLEPESRRYTRWSDRHPGLARDRINALLQDDTGTLWAASNASGLIRFEPLTGQARSYLPRPGDPASLSNASVIALAIDTQERIWVGTQNGGVCIMDTTSERFERYLPDFDADFSLNSASIYALRVDDQGIVWVGTYHGGVNYTSPYARPFELISPRPGGLSYPQIGSVLEDRGGNLWIGTDGDGLNRIDARSGRYSYFRHDPTDPTTIGSPAVTALFEDSREAIWVGGWAAGLGRLDPGTGLVRRFRHDPADPTSIVNDNVWWIIELSTGELLVATHNGVDLMDRETGTFQRLHELYPQLISEGVQKITYALLEDARGNLWIGKNDGALYIDRLADQVTVYRHDSDDPGSLGSGWVPSIHIDGADNVWFATAGGLSCLPASGPPFRRYTTSDGLPHDSINGILEDDDGSLWLSTNRGLSKFSEAVSLPEEPSFRNFDVHDGLQGQEFGRAVAHRGPSGRLYFAGGRGLNTFRPEDVRQNPYVPPVIFTDLKIGGESQAPGVEDSPLVRSITETDALELGPEHRVVTFEFAALDLVLPQKNRYSYRLEPFDAEWTETMDGSATYRNLPAGRYVFRVRGANNDGIWNEEGRFLALRVHPPWYETPWFTAIWVSALLGMAVFLYRRRMQEMRKRAEELEQRVAERTADLKESIAQHERAEKKLAEQVEERTRAEQETRSLADKLSSANDEMAQNQQAIERENDERKRAEEAAGRERDLLHSLMDNIPDLIYFKDDQSRYTRINRAHARALGLNRPQDAEGKTDQDFYAPEFAHATRDEERDLIRSGEPILGKLQHDQRAGRWYLATKVPTRDAAGRATGLVGISKDITERRQAEARLEQELEGFQQVVSAAAEGDLAVRSQEGDGTLGRIARVVNEMFEAVARILAEARDAAFSVSTSSSEILAAATQIAKGAQHQSDEVHTTSTAVDEMATSMRQVSETAERSAKSAQAVLEHVQEGDRSVEEVYAGMTRIDQAVAHTADKMHQLENRSKEIFGLIELIDDVAAQSKLLSLNAAIEAAHAGDAGKGFGVVAEEIRRLAERSTQATQDVTGFVEGIVEDTKAALEAMQAGLNEVAQGRGLAEGARGSLHEISELVQESAQLSASISYSSREQSGAAQTAADAMQTVASITEQSAAGARETSRAVKSLVDLSEQLNRTISRFKIGNDKSQP